MTALHPEHIVPATLPEPCNLHCSGVAAGVDGNSIVVGVNVNAPPGTMVGVVGENGSGKSTLLRVIAGLDSPLDGTVTINGERLHDLPRKVRARTLAWVGQEDVPSEDLLVWQAVALGLTPYQNPWKGETSRQRHDIGRALQLVNLYDYADRRCDQLSGGERRRVMLARGLVQGTGLLVLDEPTNHLDIAHQHQLLRVLKDTGKTVVVSMHDLDLVHSLFDLVIVLPPASARGTRPICGPVAEVLTPDVIRRAFGVDATILTDPDTGRTHIVIRHSIIPPSTRITGNGSHI